MNTVAWYVPELIEGSGGHRTIFAMADALRRRGFNTKIFLQYSVQTPRRAVAAFGYAFDEVHSSWQAQPQADIAIATVWHSAAFVAGLECRHKFYFVQDYEALFHPVGDGFLMAENSYRLGLTVITMGRWLARKISALTGESCYAVDFGADENIYFNDRRADDSVHGHAPGGAKNPSVCFINQPDKPRRCARLGLEALALLKRERPQTDIVLYGSPRYLTRRPGFECKNLGLISAKECARLYNQAGVGLCMSPTNPSRIPFEMMACGLPVVDIYRENNLYDYPDGAITLAEQTPQSIAEALAGLLDDPQARARRGANSQTFMRDRSQQNEGAQFADLVARALAGGAGDAPEITRMYFAPPVVSPRPAPTTPAAAVGTPRRRVLKAAYFKVLRMLPGRLARRVDALARALKTALGR